MGAATVLLVTLVSFLLGSAYSQPAHQDSDEGRQSTEITCLQGTDLPGEEGRAKMKKKGKLLVSLLLGLKLLGLSVAIPLIIALALYSAWKGVTISLLAFMIASIVGIKSLISKSHDDKSAHNLIVAKIPGSPQEQWWRRLGGDLAPLGLGLDPYRAYGFPSTF